jgi:hypothetical protein
MAFIGNQPTAVPLTSSQLTDGLITSAKIADGAVVNVDVNSTAAIAYSKLNLATSIVNGDIANATIALAKLSATGTPSASTFLRGDNSWASAGATAGQIIQVVSVNKTDTFTSTATGTGTDVTGMSVSITPSSASNKILVMCSVNIAVGGAGEADILRGLKVVKVISASETNSSPVADASGDEGLFTVFNQRSVFDKNGVLFSTMQYLDSPSTTSAITYKLQFGTGALAQAGTIYINRTDADNYMRGASTITVMEVKG